jgi:hypothetical protein
MKDNVAAAINAYNELPVQKCVAMLYLQLYSHCKPEHMEIAAQTLFCASFRYHQHHDIVYAPAAYHQLHSDSLYLQSGR